MKQKLNGLKMEFTKHTTIEVTVDKIKELTFNRAKSEKHVQALVKSIANVGVLRTPVLAYTKCISGKLEYYNVDGQHLVESLKRLNIKKVNAIVVETESVNKIVEMMAILNNVQQKWTLVDYINAYCGLGNENYFKLKAHFLTNGLTPAVSSMILSGNASSGKGLNGIRNGNFQVTAEDSVQLTKDLIEASALVKTTNAKFHGAFCNFYRSQGKKYNHTRMLTALRGNTDFDNIPHDITYINGLISKAYTNAK
jgi:uncharacterized ParB-like nuclease family protein